MALKEFLKQKQDNLQAIIVSIAGRAEDSVSLYKSYKTRTPEPGDALIPMSNTV